MVGATSEEITRRSRRESLAKMFQQQLHVPSITAATFVGFAAVAVAYPQKAIAIFTAACAPHPECVVYAYEWGVDDLCPCITLVDVYRTPRTFEEWTAPVDVSAKVETLSRAGMLQHLQRVATLAGGTAEMQEASVHES